MKFMSIIGVLLLFVSIESKREPKLAPYIDVTREDEFDLVALKEKFGINAFSLAFTLGGIKGECMPSWAGQLPIESENIVKQIKAFRSVGGDVIVATGGAAGPYLENSCKNAEELAKAYKKVLTLTESNHLDIDIESSVPSDLMNEALKTLQKENPSLTVSFTLGVMSDDYGINVQLGVDNLKNAVKHGVEVDIVNPMTMEFSTRQSSWGDAVIGAAEATLKQMRTVWPKKSDKELYSMLGVTPMIGQNMNGKVFEPKHAQQLVDWAKNKDIGLLSFWSIGRDKGCPNKPVGPECSSIEQKDFEFTKIFAKFIDPNYKPIPITTTTKKVTHKPTHSPRTLGPITMDCSVPGRTYPHPTDCTEYYVCVNGEPMPELCATGTVWDTDKHICNFPNAANREECL